MNSRVYWAGRHEHITVTYYTLLSCRQLRAATQGDLDYPRTRTVTYDSRAFAVSGPTCWNLLPSSLKSPSLKPAHFCKQLKTIYSWRSRRNYVTIRFARRQKLFININFSFFHAKPILCPNTICSET